MEGQRDRHELGADSRSQVAAGIFAGACAIGPRSQTAPVNDPVSALLVPRDAGVRQALFDIRAVGELAHRFTRWIGHTNDAHLSAGVPFIARTEPANGV